MPGWTGSTPGCGLQPRRLANDAGASQSPEQAEGRLPSAEISGPMLARPLPVAVAQENDRATPRTPASACSRRSPGAIRLFRFMPYFSGVTALFRSDNPVGIMSIRGIFCNLIERMQTVVCRSGRGSPVVAGRVPAQRKGRGSGSATSPSQAASIAGQPIFCLPRLSHRRPDRVAASDIAVTPALGHGIHGYSGRRPA